MRASSVVLLVLAAQALLAIHVHGFAWRLFAGRYVIYDFENMMAPVERAMPFFVTSDDQN